MKKLFIILAAVAMVFVACKKENKDNPVNPTPSITEHIIGKWITSDADAQPVVTNEKGHGQGAARQRGGSEAPEPEADRAGGGLRADQVRPRLQTLPLEVD